MSPYAHIVVAVDFYPASSRALALAAALGARSGAVLELVHAWEPPGFLPADSVIELPGRPARTVRAMAEDRSREAMRLLDAVIPNYPRERIRERVEQGPPVEVILEAARAGGADLIAVGRHTRSGVARVSLGGVAEQVVRGAACPVLVAPELPPQACAAEPHHGDAGAALSRSSLRRVLFPTDLSSGSRRALSEAEAIARSFGAELDVLHTWEEPIPLVTDALLSSHGCAPVYVRADANRDLTSWLRDAHLDPSVAVHTSLERGAAGEAILRRAERAEHDLIVMATHGQAGVERWLRGSITEKVLRRSTTPVLAVPPTHVRS